MPDYHPSNLVLAIAEAMHEADNYYVSYDQARAAMNLVLEEAALLVDENAAVCSGNITLHDILRGNAAAIRALKE